jgi:hypothetical protein
MHQKNLVIIICALLVLTTLFLFPQTQAITWSVTTRRFTDYTYYDGFPAFAQTKDGRIWFVWSKEIQGNLSLYYKTSSDQGRTWAAEKNLTAVFPSPGENQNPSITQAQNGTILVTWASDRPPPPLPGFLIDASPQNISISQGESGNALVTVTSVNGFNGTVNLTVLNQPTGVAATLDPPQVAPPADGTANSALTILVDATATPGNYTLYVRGRSGKLMNDIEVYLEITLSGSTPGSFSQNAAGSNLLSSPQGTTSSDDYEIYYKSSHDNGVTWSRDTQLTNNGVDDLDPAIIQLTNGTILIFWQSYTGEDYDICYKTTTNGISWSETKQLTTDPLVDTEPAVTQAKDGKLWLVWASNRYGNYEICYKTYDGSTWSADLRLTTNTNTDIQPAIVQAVDGNMMVFWASSSTTGTYDICYAYSVDGSTWSSRIEFAASGYEDIWPTLMRTQDTKILVAWVSNEADQPIGNWDVYYRSSLAGDINEDHVVNVIDLTWVSLSYGFFSGEQGYNPVADVNKDGIVDMRDLSTVAYYLGET